MCQMSIIVEKNGQEEVVLKNAAQLEVVEEGIKVSALFEEPLIIANVFVNRIDFLDGEVRLKHRP